ncbi:hypothetical protein COBT_003839, partial [Conglomerata obtusa]
HHNTSNEVHITFFTYLDLYLCVKDIQKDDAFEIEVTMSMQNNPNILNAYYCGGTRVIKIMDAPKTKQEYEELAVKFGEVEAVLAEDNNIEIRFLGIMSALKFGKYSFSDPYVKARISFGEDPCCQSKRIRTDFLDDGFYNENRTVYLGGIKDDITAKDLFEKIKGGNVFSLKIKREKKCAFLVFFDVNSANAFIEFYTIQDFVVNGHKLKVSRGTETKIPFSNILMCYSGATRAIMVSNGDGKATEEKIREDFEKFGEIEMINYIGANNFLFINFLNIYEAYSSYVTLKNESFYKEHRIGFGKDKCNSENAEDLMNQIINLRD